MLRAILCYSAVIAMDIAILCHGGTIKIKCNGPLSHCYAEMNTCIALHCIAQVPLSSPDLSRKVIYSAIVQFNCCMDLSALTCITVSCNGFPMVCFFYRLQSSQCIVIHCCALFFILFQRQCINYSVLHFIFSALQSTLNSVQFTVYSVHCTLYSLQCIPLDPAANPAPALAIHLLLCCFPSTFSAFSNCHRCQNGRHICHCHIAT